MNYGCEVLYLFYASFVFSFIHLIFNYSNFIQFKGCPNCFGDELCGAFKFGHLQFEFWSILSLIFNEKLTRGVFFGYLNGNKIVVKRFNGDSILRGPNELNSVILCNNSQVTFPKFIRKMLRSNNTDFWLNFEVTIEPVLLKIFSPQGWPFPQYMGACGEHVVMSDKGVRLIYYFDHPWIVRAHLARQLLQASELFTSKHSSFSLYFTDLSPDNIVVDEEGQISFVDLDNVIISDREKQQETPLSDSNTIHCTTTQANRLFQFSSDDICNHHVSDHNYYSVCQHLISYTEMTSNGLLHDIPTEVLSKYPILMKYVTECSLPVFYTDRITPGRHLLHLLQEILEGFIWDQYLNY